MLVRCQSEGGQAAVELALILPIMILLIFGMMEFGIIFHDYLVVSQAAREGARAGVISGSTTNITDAVYSTAASLDLSKLVVTITPPEGQRGRGTSLSVHAVYSVPIVVPVISALLPNPFPIAVTATMRME